MRSDLICLIVTVRCLVSSYRVNVFYIYFNHALLLFKKWTVFRQITEVTCLVG